MKGRCKTKTPELRNISAEFSFLLRGYIRKRTFFSLRFSEREMPCPIKKDE